MFCKCCSFGFNKIWPVLLFGVAFLRNVKAAATAAGCRTFIIASTLGTLAACLFILAVVVFLIRRFSRKPETRGSLRKVDLEQSSPTESVQFENAAAISQDKDDTDSGIASPVAPTTADSQAIVTKNVSTQTCEYSSTKRKQHSVVIEKRQNGTLGLNLAIAGLYVKGTDTDTTGKHVASVEPGDEIVSINGTMVEGMTDMEALALIANSGPSVQLQIVKHAFLWRVDDTHGRIHQKKKNTQSPQSSLCDVEALKKAKLEIGEALMELRRCTSYNSKTVHATCLKSHEKNNSQQSFMDSVELQRAIAEEDFVVIESPEVSQCQTNEQGKADNAEVASEENIPPVSNANNNVTMLHSHKTDSSVGLTTGFGTVQEEYKNKSPVVDPVCDSKHIQNDSPVTKALTSGITELHSDITDLSNRIEETWNNKALSLQLNTDIPRQSKNTSPAEEPQGFPMVNSNHSHAGSPMHGSTIGSTQPTAYYVVENGHVASPVYYNAAEEDVLSANYMPNLDKIKPPPSYEIASLTFNSQKPGVRSYSGGSAVGSSSADFNIPVNTESSQMNSIHNSTDSSFDDLDPAIPVYYSKSPRESISIDEHVMRYMTKKYSEPRFPVTASNSSTTVSPIAPSSSTPRFIQPDYISRSRSGSEYLDVTQPSIPVLANEYHRKAPKDCIDGSTFPASSAALRQNSIVDSYSGMELSGMYMDDTKHNIVHHNNDRELISKDGIVLNPGLQNQRLPSKPAADSLTDIHREFTSSLEITPVEYSKEMQITNKLQKLGMNRPGRLLRQRLPNGDIAKNIRRAASSPSVNADHQRGGSNESYSTDSQSVQRRNQRNQKNRKSKGESFDRRKSIDSGSLRKLAAELQSNQSLSDDLPMISLLLGGVGFPNADRTSNLYRYNSSDTLY